MSYAVPERQGQGWLLFAALVMITGGIMRLVDAFWAFDKDDEMAGELLAVVWSDNLAAYGWLWLVVGTLLLVAGFSVMGGSEWARWLGIVMAIVTAVSATLWIWDYPIWSLVNVMIAALVIYGLSVYGGREAAQGA